MVVWARLNNTRSFSLICENNTPKNDYCHSTGGLSSACTKLEPASNKGLFRFRMRNEILRRSEKIETRSKKHDFSDRNSPVYVIQWGLLAVYRTPVHVQCCFIITQKLLLEASKTNTSFARLSASSSYVSLDLQQDNMHFALTLLQCFYHAN